MKRVFVAVFLAWAMGVTPGAADDAVVPTSTPSTDQPSATSGPSTAWQEPAATVTADPADVVEQSGETGEMTVVYAVQDGDSLRVVSDTATSTSDAIATVDQVQDRPDVVAVEVDTTRRLTGLPASQSRPGVTSTIRRESRAAAIPSADPSRSQQWALDALDAETAWASSTGTGVTVAVIDSGVSRHPDLAGKFVRGVDLVNGGNGRMDSNGHGTHVAGIIAMTANNNLGGAGLAPGVAIMPVVVADAGGSVRSADSAKGIIWAVDHGADIVNMSYSGSASSVEQKAIQYAQSKGVVTVAAAGNAYLDSRGTLFNPVQYPAAFPGVVGVGAVTRTLRRSSFSEVGRQVDLVAPGGSGAFDSPRGIFSTYAGSGYVRMPGTSMAAPYVSGTMALTIERQRALGLQVNPVDVVLGSATDLGAQGRDDQFGFGLVSPNRALSTLNTLQATGGALPVIAPAEVTTRAVKRVRITVRKGYLKYRIPAKGRFIVGWQSYSQRKWSELNRFNGKRDGQTWYTVRSSGGMQVRIVAMRAGQKKKTDPIWVSRTFRTRAASPR
ncbi:MAG: S8 family serine peptidase [Actinobacteria bacterium]|nr:S8 family serine peptidase [Actinomycetota bacterium]MCO5299558.1 S8 family serine peptidase [Candidatus Nanopelagicales bacterium]MCB9428150.1 S8 family serine peptidase [Actinomycetota bacterium]HPE10871.1 S8 family serine peptidase [Actinomycetota bacterium]HPJ17621.1 S8 family serine peptidase [Actinomycetota bacterium]